MGSHPAKRMEGTLKLRPLSIVDEQTWVRVFRADACTSQGGLCRYCQEPLTRTTLTGDHAVPRALGGTTERSNIRAACANCNLAKGRMPEKAFLSAIKTLAPGASLRMMLAYSRRRIWVRTHRACERIERRAR